MLIDLDNRYSQYTHLHIMLTTNNNHRLDDLSAIAFNNKMNNRFSSKSSIKNGGMKKEKTGEWERKKKLQT